MTTDARLLGLLRPQLPPGRPRHRLPALGTAASPLQHFWSLGGRGAVLRRLAGRRHLLLVLGRLLGRRTGRILLLVLVLVVVASSAIASASADRDVGRPGRTSGSTPGPGSSPSAPCVALTARATRRPAAAPGRGARLGRARRHRRSAPCATPTPPPSPASPPGCPSAARLPSSPPAAAPGVGAERVLAEPLMQCLGRVSYSWYLWHWPMLVITPYAAGHALGAWERGAVVWLSLAVAVACFVWVEQPVRRLTWPTWQWVGTGGLIVATVAACSLGVAVLAPRTTGSGAAPCWPAWPARRARRRRRAAAGAAGPQPPSRSATSSPAPSPGRSTPAPCPPTSPRRRRTPRPRCRPPRRNGCHAGFTAISQGDCAYGDLDRDRTVVLFGDSHAEQWLPALDLAAKEQHWQGRQLDQGGLPRRAADRLQPVAQPRPTPSATPGARRRSRGSAPCTPRSWSSASRRTSRRRA